MSCCHNTKQAEQSKVRDLLHTSCTKPLYGSYVQVGDSKVACGRY
jgi:hypothetical protein